MKDKKLEDVIHLYIGCDVTICEYEGAPFKARLTGIITERTDHESMIRVQVVILDDEDDGGHIAWYDLDEVVELHLKQLSDMTEEDSLMVFGVKSRYKLFQEGLGEKILNICDFCLFTPNETQRLLSRGFDLFGRLPSTCMRSVYEACNDEVRPIEDYKTGYQDGYKEGWNNLIDNIIKDIRLYQLPDSEDSRWTLSGLEKELKKIRK